MTFSGQDHAMDGSTLYADPDVRFYDEADGQDSLLRELQEQDRHTILSPFDDPKQALLKPDGRTQQGNLRFSSISFRQLCRILSPGLGNVVTDLAGLRRVDDAADKDLYSVADSIHLLNTLVARRFRSRLEGLQTIRDTRTGVIEGIVGRAYKRLPNLELYERADDILQSYRQPVVFAKAAIFGRYLVLCYKGKEPLFEAQFPGDRVDTFYGGYYYSNSEIGDGSVRATTALIRAIDGTRCLGSYASVGGKEVHLGKKFRERFEMLLNKVSGQIPDDYYLRNCVEMLASKPLGFSGTDDDVDESRFVAISNWLQNRHLSRGLARKVVRGVLCQGSFDHQPFEDVSQIQRSIWSGRTVYDLFNAMTRVALILPVTQQENLEQMAYALLTGRLLLPKSLQGDS